MYDRHNCHIFICKTDSSDQNFTWALASRHAWDILELLNLTSLFLNKNNLLNFCCQVAITVLPLNVAYSVLGKWIFGSITCKIWLTADVLCCTASILNLCAIALDRSVSFFLSFIKLVYFRFSNCFLGSNNIIIN